MITIAENPKPFKKVVVVKTLTCHFIFKVFGMNITFVKRTTEIHQLIRSNRSGREFY